MKLKTRINTLIIPIILIICLTYSVVLMKAVHNTSMDQAKDSLQDNIRMFNYIVETRYDGEYKIVEGNLHKGNSKIDWQSILTMLNSNETHEYSIFVEDTRMVTTMDGTEGLLGGKADEAVIEKVLKNGERLTVAIKIDGEPFFAIYEPIKDDDGSVLGMIFAGYNRTSDLNKVISVVQKSVIWMTVLSIIILFIANKVVDKISKRINYLCNMVNLLRNKDFTQVPDEKLLMGKDEISEMGSHVIDMQNDLGATIYQINQLTNKVTGEANMLASAAEEMSKVTENVTLTMQEIASGASNQAEDIISINEAAQLLGESVVKVGHAISGIDQQTKDISGIADMSYQEMQEVIQVVSGFTKVFSEYENRMKEFERNMTKIDEIIVAISSISDQTNLLALNAAIEAARAGEAGKGFSVVANEIRNLAEESRKSTEDIERIISLVSKEARQLGESTNVMSQELQEEEKSLEKMVHSFRQILEAINNIVPHIEAVNDEADVLEEQKDSILSRIENTSSIAQEVSAACEEVAAATEEMNASTKEVAESADQLDGMTKQLKDETSSFKIMEQ